MEADDDEVMEADAVTFDLGEVKLCTELGYAVPPAMTAELFQMPPPTTTAGTVPVGALLTTEPDAVNP